MSVIELQNVCKSYKDGERVNHVLKNINLRVEEGEFVAVLGQSGSGKSTLLKLLGTLETPTEGQIILDGENVSKLSDAKLSKIRRQKIGFVYQDYSVSRVFGV